MLTIIGSIILKKKIMFFINYLIPKISEKILRTINNIDLIILPGGNDVIKKDKYTKTRLLVEKNTISYGLKKNIPILEYAEECK